MDEKESTDQEEWMTQGKKELEEWYARLNEQLGKTKENNRYSFISSMIIYLEKWSVFAVRMVTHLNKFYSQHTSVPF